MRGTDQKLDRLKYAWNNGKLRQGQLGTLFLEHFGEQERRTKLFLMAYIYGEMDPEHGNLLDLWEGGRELSPVDELTHRTVGA